MYSFCSKVGGLLTLGRPVPKAPYKGELWGREVLRRFEKSDFFFL